MKTTSRLGGISMPLLVLCTLFAYFAFVPTTAHGYVTTGQSAVSISDTAALYTITYRFGSDKYDFYLPIMAVRDLAHGAGTKSLGYSMLEEGKATTTTGTAAGIVLSSAEIVDGLYKIPKGHAGNFTLFVIFSVPQSDEETDYALKVDELPFFYSDERIAQHLNPSELQKYVTPKVPMNDEG